MHQLEIPFSEDSLRSLGVGDIVMLTGVLWTSGSRFHVRVVEEGILPPIDTKKYHVMLHGEPIVVKQDGEWKLRAGSITASSRFEKWEPEAIRRLHLRAIVGKGRVGKRTLAAMKESGCIHLIRSGLFPGPYVTMMEGIREVHWLDLGLPEALWVIQVRNFGPLIVEADLRGESLYEKVGERIDEKIPSIYKSLGINGCTSDR